MMSSSTSGGAQLGTRNVPFTPITRQNSIFSLTMDELQNAIEPGKHFGSMNMDEFLKNVWSAEESQAMSVALTSNNESNAPQPGGQATGSGLVRQGSLTHPGSLSLSRTLSRKTVDEVWRDIHRVPEPTAKEQQRATNYGEMTLEDFLVKAGVVREDSEAGSPASNNTSNYTASYPAQLASQNPFHGSSSLAQSTHQVTMEAIAHNQHQQQIEWHNYQLKSNAMQQQQHVLQQQAQEAAAYAMPKRGPVIAIPGTPSGSGLEGSSDGGLQVNGLSPAITTPDTPNRGRKRGPEALPEKTVERRQRRMIKNRESAARSRARKQAYTVELESEVTQLKEENSRLKKENEEHTKRRRQELLESPPEKCPVLRRSRTISW